MDQQPINNSNQKNQNQNSDSQVTSITSPIHDDYIHTQSVGLAEQNIDNTPQLQTDYPIQTPTEVTTQNKDIEIGFKAINFTALLASLSLAIGLFVAFLSPYFSGNFSPSLSIFLTIIGLGAFGIGWIISLILIVKAVKAINKKLGLMNLILIGLVALMIIVGFTVDNYGIVNAIGSVFWVSIGLFIINLVISMIVILVKLTRYLKIIKMSAKKQVFFGVVAILGTIVSFGVAGFIVALFLSVRACELSGSSKCL
jgi:hypothetical protein